MREEEEKKRKRAEKFGTTSEPVRRCLVFKVENSCVIRPTRRPRSKVSEVSVCDHGVTSKSCIPVLQEKTYMPCVNPKCYTRRSRLVLHLLLLVDRSAKLDLFVAERGLLFLNDLVGAKVMSAVYYVPDRKAH